MNLSRQFLKKSILSFVLVFVATLLYSQSVKNFSIEDGLPGNSIKCLFKDSKGLLWIATETGLCTYNGNDFKIIGSDQGLKYNLIWDITEDDKKNIWLSVYGYGIAKFDGRKFSYYSTKSGLINNHVRKVYFSKKHNCMVFGTEDGLSIFNGTKFKNFPIKAKNHGSRFQINFISTYKNDIVFNGSYDDSYKLKIDHHHFEQSTLIKFKHTNTQNYSGLIHYNHYYGRNYKDQFERLNLKTNQREIYGLCTNIWDLAVGKNNTIYVATWDGNSPLGAILSFKNGVLTNISEKLNLPTSQFWDLMFDEKANQLWVGTVDRGVFVIDLDEKITFEKINFGNVKPEINTLYIDHLQNLWIGGNDFMIMQDKYKVNKRISSDNIINYLKKVSKQNNLKSVLITDLLKVKKSVVFHTIKGDGSGNIWVSTNVGMFCFNQKLEIIHYFFKHDTAGVFDFISPSKLFLSHAYTFSYLVSVKQTTDIKEVNLNGKKIGLDALRIVKTKNRLWIASWLKGLFLYENNKLVSLKDLGRFNENNILDIIEDEHQNLVIGTGNGKVYFSKWQHQRLKHLRILYPDKDIIGNSIFFIRKHKNFYFIGTNKGLNIVKDYKLYKFINQDENLPQTTYTDACIDNVNKKLYISSYKGIIGIDLRKILSSENLNSPIRLNQIKVNGKIVPTSRNLNLNHYQNTLEFEFGSNNNYNAKKNYFTYKIVGLTNNWSELSTANSLKLFDLKSGTYQLTIKGKNIGTNEKLQPLHLQLIIHPPFWETWWFIGLFIAVVISLITVFIKQKINQIKNKSVVEKRIAETKLQALQSQMNPHFVFNAMNSIQNFVIDNQTDKALWYIGEFSKLMRQTLDFSSRHTISLLDEMEYLNRYVELENLRRIKKVVFLLKISGNLDSNSIDLPPMLIQPIIENAFIHAFDKNSNDPQIEIAFQWKQDKLVCTVTDNGKGVHAAKQQSKQSKGIKLVDERIRLLTGTDEKMIQMLSNTTGGTIVIMTIPLR